MTKEHDFLDRVGSTTVDESNSSTMESSPPDDYAMRLARLEKVMEAVMKEKEELMSLFSGNRQQQKPEPAVQQPSTVDGPKSYEEFSTALKSSSVQESTPKGSLEEEEIPREANLENGIEEKEAGLQPVEEDQDFDTVDGKQDFDTVNGEAAVTVGRSYGEQTLIFRCTKDTIGTELDAAVYRMFTASYRLTHRNENHQIWLNLLRKPPKDDEVVPCTLGICFPYQPDVGDQFYFDNYRIVISILSPENEAVVTKEADIYVENNLCIREDPPGRSHVNCSSPTEILEDYFDVKESIQQHLFDNNCIQMKELRDSLQCFYFKATVEVFELVDDFVDQEDPDDNSATLKEYIDQAPSEEKCVQSEDQIDSGCAPAPAPEQELEFNSKTAIVTEFVAQEPPKKEPTATVSETEDLALQHPLVRKLSKGGLDAFKSWILKEGSEEWCKDVSVNLELIHFAHRAQVPALVHQVMKNLQEIPDEDFTLGFAIDALAAAAMYKIEMPELMSRFAHFILS